MCFCVRKTITLRRNGGELGIQEKAGNGIHVPCANESFRLRLYVRFMSGEVYQPSYIGGTTTINLTTLSFGESLLTTSSGPAAQCDRL